MNTKEVEDSLKHLPEAFLARCLSKVKGAALEEKPKADLVRLFQETVVELAISNFVEHLDADSLQQTLQVLGFPSTTTATQLTSQLDVKGIESLIEKADEALIKQFGVVLVTLFIEIFLFTDLYVQ